MNVKELKSKEIELRNEAASLETLFQHAVIKYLNTIVGSVLQVVKQMTKTEKHVLKKFMHIIIVTVI